ncbi:TldD/PmbA family protein [bacterium]|nr:TldD/PmbA family protein [bacterium]
MSLEEIADILLRGAARHGATAADVVVAEGDALTVGVRLGAVEKVQRARGKHLGLRAFAGERSAILSTADFSPAALAQLAADAVALARVTAPDPFSGLPDAAELATAPPTLDLFDPAVGEVTAEQATEWCLAAETAARDADPRITNSEGAEFDGGSHLVLYAASNGFSGSYRSSSCSLSCVPVATHDGGMERDHWYSVQRYLARLESPESIGRTAAARALRRLGARQVATCECPVVFDPDMAGSLLRHLAGAVSGGAIYRGLSFLAGKLGQTIAPASLSVYDDGLLADGLGSKPFDGEGLPTRRTPVIEDGVLTSYLCDTYAARKLSCRPTGNAARSVGDSPHVSPTNFFLPAGTATPEAIIGSVRQGLYVTELMGFGVNATTGDYSRGASGLWIENGQLTYPVSEITIAGNLLQMLRDIEVVGSDLVLRHSIAAPTLKIARMTVAGT